MSNPDELATLKATVRVYEKEIEDALGEMADLREKGHLTLDTFAMASTSLADKLAKTIKAQREYIHALEKLVPR